MKKVYQPNVSLIVAIYKLLSGIVELLLGISILFFGRNISRVYTGYKLRELLEDPHDQFIVLVQKIIPTLAQYHLYFMISLLIFGIVKIIAAIGLFYDEEWGLDLLIIFFFLFLPYDSITFFSHPSVLKTLYFFVNVFITMYLIEFKPHTYFWKYVKYVRKKIKMK